MKTNMAATSYYPRILSHSRRITWTETINGKLQFTVCSKMAKPSSKCFLFNKNSGDQWKGTFRLYRPDPTQATACLVIVLASRIRNSGTILSNVKGHFSPTDQNDRTGIIRDKFVLSACYPHNFTLSGKRSRSLCKITFTANGKRQIGVETVSQNRKWADENIPRQMLQTKLKWCC